MHSLNVLNFRETTQTTGVCTTHDINGQHCCDMVSVSSLLSAQNNLQQHHVCTSPESWNMVVELGRDVAAMLDVDGLRLEGNIMNSEKDPDSDRTAVLLFSFHGARCQPQSSQVMAERERSRIRIVVEGFASTDRRL